MDDVLQEIRLDEQTKGVEVTRISEELGIKPSWSFAKGEAYSGRRLNPETKEVVTVQQQRPWGVWAVDTKSLAQVQVVQEHILYLLRLLEPTQDKLKKYLEQKERYQVRFSIQWSPTGEYGGSYEVDSEILIRMARLSHYIEFGFAPMP